MIKKLFKDTTKPFIGVALRASVCATPNELVDLFGPYPFPEKGAKAGWRKEHSGDLIAIYIHCEDEEIDHDQFYRISIGAKGYRECANATFWIGEYLAELRNTGPDSPEEEIKKALARLDRLFYEAQEESGKFETKYDFASEKVREIRELLGGTNPQKN